MEDRYLFKAKRVSNGEWIVGGLVRYGFTGKEKYYIVPDYASDLYAIEIDPFTICRCIGSQDKNGKLIYENDIVWDSGERAFYEIIWNQEDMCWNVEDADGHKSEFEECYGSTIEVNGNRFDNPELLESGG